MLRRARRAVVVNVIQAGIRSYRNLLNPSSQADGFLDVEVFARLEADFLRAVDDIEPARPLHIARITAQLAAEHVTIGIRAVVQIWVATETSVDGRISPIAECEIDFRGWFYFEIADRDPNAEHTGAVGDEIPHPRHWIVHH